MRLQKIEDSGSSTRSRWSKDLVININNRFTDILGVGNNFEVSLKTMDIDPNKLIYH